MRFQISKKHIINVVTDVRFWLLLFFVVRLIGITNPPLESGHSWRQTLTNMVARNFYETNANICYPMIDVAGEKSGVMTSEFPLYNYLIFLVSKVFGFTHWHGRWISLMVSTFGLYCYYQLLAKLINPKLALTATLITLSSLWFAYSRKIMPDTFSVSLVFIGLYFVYLYLKEGSLKHLIFYFIFATLGVLSKIPALSLLAVLIVLPWLSTVVWRRKVNVIVCSVIGFSVVCLWYFYWVPYIFDTYHYQLYFPKTFTEGAREVFTVLPQLFEKFYFSSLNSFVAFGCFVLGILFLVRKRNRSLQLALVAISTVFGLFILKTGAVFPTHSYYVIPFAPIMALIAAYFIQTLPKKLGLIILGLIVIEGVANQQHDFFLRDTQVYKLELESTIDPIIPKNDLVIINGGTTPLNMYFAHRKGWASRNESVQHVAYIDSLQQLGAQYLIIDKHQSGAHEMPYKTVLDDDNYAVYSLKE
ncbi:MAG: hypothetical protein ACI9JN_002298 [Bacteroidia bacterium]|jgi:hypothetical protein